MKKRTMVMTVTMVMMFTAGALTQTQRSSKSSISDTGKKNYIMALQSSNQGLAESAMMQVAKIKMMAPAAGFEEIKKVIDSLTVYGNTPSIRYKAYLASNVYENPTWFAKKSYAEYQDNDEFFVAVAAQLQERILGSRAN